MAIQELPVTTGRPARHRDVRVSPTLLRRRDWAHLASLGVLSIIVAAVFYRVTVLFFVDGVAGHVAAVGLSLLVHGALAARTILRQRRIRRTAGQARDELASLV